MLQKVNIAKNAKSIRKEMKEQEERKKENSLMNIILIDGKLQAKQQIVCENSLLTVIFIIIIDCKPLALTNRSFCVFQQNIFAPSHKLC